MIQDVTITLFSVEKADNIDETLIQKNIAKQLHCSENQINGFTLKKKSLDARHGKVKVHLKYTVYTEKDFPEKSSGENFVPEYKNADGSKTVIVVGSGPAGLFSALRLLEAGIKPVVVERGNTAKERKRDIAQISRNHKINGDSNYCFGEGGAGTFSDGKLFTRSVKRGSPERIYRLFHYFGAPKEIITASHPHIGSDLLPEIIHNMTCKIEEMGGQVLFNTKCTGFITDQNASSKKRIVGIDTVNVITGETSQIKGDAVILATGHSAPDIYQLVEQLAPEALEAKTFAVGVRVEHPRHVIDDIQYHGRQKKEKLPSAEYRLTTQVAERGVYSFCMCPGGLVVPSGSSDEGLVVNGMSPSSRSGRWSNAAIVVEIRPEDAAQIMNDQSSLAGLKLREKIEKLAKQEGKGQAAPSQRLQDFLEGELSQDLPESSYTPGLVSSRLDMWLPEHISGRLKQGFVDFDKKMKGFICPQALLIAPETRTSTPVRILRDKETYECTQIENLFPAGEGSGYSGGIVSSAIDGEKTAESIIKKMNV